VVREARDGAARRLTAGLAHVTGDPEAFACFRFMNEVMRDQRVHTQISALRSSDPALSYKDVRQRVDGAERREPSAWRPFQLAFILMQLPALTDPTAPARSGDRASASIGWRCRCGAAVDRRRPERPDRYLPGVDHARRRGDDRPAHQRGTAPHRRRSHVRGLFQLQLHPELPHVDGAAGGGRPARRERHGLPRCVRGVARGRRSYRAENSNIELGLLVHDTALASSIESTMRDKHGVLYERVVPPRGRD